MKKHNNTPLLHSINNHMLTYTNAIWLILTTLLLYNCGNATDTTPPQPLAKFTVTFKANTPTGVTATPTGIPSAETITSGQKVTEPTTTPSLAEYNFVGWFKGTETGGTATLESSAYNFSTPVTANINLYAKWTRITYTVTYYANKPTDASATVDNMPTSPVTIGSGQTATGPSSPPELADYYFAGWYKGTETNGTVTLEENAFAFSTPITENTNIYAKWVTPYTVVYNGNKPSSAPTFAVFSNLPEPVITGDGLMITEPSTPPTLTYFHFAGWHKGTETNGTVTLEENAFVFTTTTITNNTILYAKWNVRVTIKYNFPGSTDKIIYKASDSTLTVEETKPWPTRANYTGIVSWHYFLPTVEAVELSTVVSNHTPRILYAKWERSEYTVTFNTNYGTPPTTTTAESNQEGLVAKPSDPTRSGYKFLNWFTKQSPTATDEPFQFGSTEINGPTTLYAKWTDVTGKIIVKFDTQGGTDIKTQIFESSGGRPTRPTNDPTRKHFVFKNWYDMATGGTVYNFSTSVTADTTIYAQWTSKPEDKDGLLAEIDRAIARGGNTVDLNYVDTSLIKDMSFLFFKKSSFNGNISGWNVSNVENMHSMFVLARAFNQDLNNWNTAKVKKMSAMFTFAASFNGNISNWNVSNVETMLNMFALASSFNGDISNWNVGNVVSTANMFERATAFNQDLNNWNTSKVENMLTMFSRATAFNGNISNWNTAKVTSMRSMFYNATAFNQDLNNWNTSNVETMYNMFREATNFNGNISNWNVSNVETMEGMFLESTAFNGNISSWNTAEVTNMEWMFSSATSFNQDLNNWNTAKVKNMGWMFASAASFNQDLNNWNTAKVKNMRAMFQSATAFNSNISNWNLAKVTDIGYMFHTATSFNGSISSWRLPAVTKMDQMFKNASAFNQDIGGWNTAEVTNMESMFASATSFNQDLNNWNTAKVKNMGWMFANASVFNQDLNNWNTAEVTNMRAMFQSATAFNGNISNWNLAKVTDAGFMFHTATSFNGNISSWRLPAVTKMDQMFRNASAFNQNIDAWNIATAVEKINAFTGSGLATNLPSWAM